MKIQSYSIPSSPAAHINNQTIKKTILTAITILILGSILLFLTRSKKASPKPQVKQPVPESIKKILDNQAKKDSLKKNFQHLLQSDYPLFNHPENQNSPSILKAQSQLLNLEQDFIKEKLNLPQLQAQLNTLAQATNLALSKEKAAKQKQDQTTKKQDEKKYSDKLKTIEAEAEESAKKLAQEKQKIEANYQKRQAALAEEKNKVNNEYQTAMQNHNQCHQQLLQTLLNKDQTSLRYRQFNLYLNQYPHLKALSLDTVPSQSNLPIKEQTKLLRDLLNLTNTFCKPSTQPAMSIETLQKALAKLESRLAS